MKGGQEMSDQRFSKDQKRQEDGKEKNQEQILLTPPAKKLRMSRKKVEH
jgi:hypothetical protein